MFEKPARAACTAPIDDLGITRHEVDAVRAYAAELEARVEAERALSYLRDRVATLARAFEADAEAGGLDCEIAFRLSRAAFQLRRSLEEDR